MESCTFSKCSKLRVNHWTCPWHVMASQCRSFLGEFCQDIPLLVIVLFGRRLTYRISVYIYKNLERNSVCSMPGRRNRRICLASRREALRAWSINKPSHQGSTRLLGTSSIRPPSRSTVAMPGRFTLLKWRTKSYNILTQKDKQRVQN